MRLLRHFLKKKIRTLKCEQISIGRAMAWYPKGSLGYETGSLAFMICELKISIWQALCERIGVSGE